MGTINKKWFKNRLQKNELEFLCKEVLTDDYRFDAANDFQETKTWRKATAEMFNEWYINASFIWGEKNGVINLNFANSEIYEFRLINNV